MGRRPPYDRVLIVSEGKKTEPLYFDDIRKKNRIPSAHISVLHSDYGTQPRQVVDFAEAKFLETKEFEWVFAVFDRDDHGTYHDALARAKALDKKLKNSERKSVRFLAIPSVPCFELWLLMHFVNQQAFCDRHEMLHRLRQHIAGYNKGQTGVFALTEANFPTATARATWLRNNFTPYTGTDPYTDADILVAKLLGLAG
jgi:hypothetical protein